MAKAVLAGCEDSPLPTPDALLPPAEDDPPKQKNSASGPPSSSCRLGTLSPSSLPPGEKPSHPVSAEQGLRLPAWCTPWVV